MAPSLPELPCRKCGRLNPCVYLSPVVLAGSGTCICMDSAEAPVWLDEARNLKPGITL
jgi:hypothetical protein